MKKINKNFIIGGCLFLLFTIFTVIVKFVDVQAIGPLCSKIGLAEFNELFLVDSTSKFWDLVSDLILVVSLTFACSFVVLGCVQVFKRKSIKKVDNNIFVIAGFFVAVVIVIVFFELVVVNCRPILENGELVASYPSTHVLVSFSILMSGLIQLHKYYMKNCKMLVVADILVAVISVLLVVSRLLSGVHWMTDIIGSLLISGALIYIYNGVLETIKAKIEKNKTLD